MKEIENKVARNMEKIMRVFRNAKSIAEKGTSIDELSKDLEALEQDFRSVAFEAASMTIALRELASAGNFSSWKKFIAGPANKHASQVHAGLGWAFGQKKVFPSGLLQSLDPLLRMRVADGFGYFEGLLKPHEAIDEKMIPHILDEELHGGYNQGLGRAIYYNTRGDIDSVAGMIAAFSEPRRPHLWRGAAMAFIYVGGFSEENLFRLLDRAGEYKIQLNLAAALVARARHDAGCIDTYVKAVCMHWCKRDLKEVISITKKSEMTIARSTSAYWEWLEAIAFEFQSEPVKQKQ